MLKKLRLKFVLVNMAIAACMLLVIFSLIFQYTKADLDSETNAVMQSVLQGNYDLNNRRLPCFIVQVSVHGGVSVSGSSYYDLNSEAFIQELIQLVYTENEATGIVEKYDLRYEVVPGMFNQQIVFVDISVHRAVLNSLVQSCLVAGAVALAAFLVISVLLARWAVRPVEKAWQQQKQFVSDASHELKTPLTVVMSNAELLQNPEFEPENKAQFVNSILVMSRQMRNLVEGMLELARVDNGQPKKTFEKMEFSREVEETLLPFEPMFFEKGLILESDIQQDILVQGSRKYLRQVLEILLDNAAKYSAKGVVEVKLRRQGKGNCLLSVSNPGDPISKEDLGKILERFYRADEARSRTGSFGLGLSIARSIVEEHRGKIWAESNETGNCFYVTLPCSN